jgi:hypothetical protein
MQLCWLMEISLVVGERELVADVVIDRRPLIRKSDVREDNGSVSFD